MGAIFLIVLLFGPGLRPAQVGGETPEPLPGTLSRYEIDATLDPDLSAINADMTVDWMNTTGQPQGSVFFRVYPNAAYYGEGALTVLAASVDGDPVAALLAADPTVLEVPLPANVGAGQRASITLRFQTVVPAQPADALGIFQRDGRGIWSLANWYPIIAAFEPGTGWNLDVPTSFGDPMFSDAASYEVRFRTPTGHTVFGTGTEASTIDADGTLLTEFAAPVAREFALTVIPGEIGGDVAAPSARAGNVTISLTLPREMMIPGVEETILETAAEALPVFADWLGEYPGENLDLTLVSLSGASAVSFAGTIWFDLDSLIADGDLNEFEVIALRFAVVHEIGHQWIGNIIGANTNAHQFMGEGLVNMLSIAVIREIAGTAEAERYLRADVAGGYLALLRDGRDGVADQPITEELNGVLHAFVVYGKGALGFEAIRQQIGNDAFLTAMTTYGEEFRFGIATPDDLRRVLEEASGEDLGEPWAFWFERSDATLADAEAILDAYASTAN